MGSYLCPTRCLDSQADRREFQDAVVLCHPCSSVQLGCVAMLPIERSPEVQASGSSDSPVTASKVSGPQCIRERSRIRESWAIQVT